ncbi:MAG: aromatic hydrocarbon degradation protein [Bacteroidales bacterium]|nr:aromatic hydrocarbon degradation protein [Bacteroidales bacterium]
MKKNLFLLAFLSLITNSAFSGGLLTNTNQSVHFLRNPARDASTEMDAVYRNPAGLTYLTDGFHLSLSNQSVLQTRTITSTFAPFAANGSSATKTYEGETNSPIVPSVQFAYKKNAWVFSGEFAVVGGGGKATFNHGLPSFESQVSMIPIALSLAGMPTTAYSMDCSMEGSSYIFGLQLNESYQFSDAFSGAIGLRVNKVINGYKGSLTNIQINPQHPLLNPSGNMISAPTFFTNAGMASYAAATTDKQIDCTQSGWGFSPIVSLNYHVSGLNLSAKYEFKSSIEVENNTVVDYNNMYPDGAKTANDIPALLTVGAAYDISDKWTVSGGYHHFFDSDAKMAKNKQQYINGGINEYLFGSEYDINDKFLVSAGVQFTNTGVTDAYQSDMNYSLDSYSIGLGGAMNINSNLRLNVGYFFTIYSDWTKNTIATNATNGYNGTPINGKDVYGRTNNVFGIGLDYKF